MIYDDRVCALGEGPLWHPERHQLFWFDILNRKLMTRSAGSQGEWSFGERASAAGWVSRDELLIASERELFLFDLESGRRQTVVPLEADNPVTRSNDGRADPWGGFWIGTMGLNAEPGAGAIYRYYRGELRQLYPAITIPNAICFAPDWAYAYFTDTARKVVGRVALASTDGWPEADPDPLLDLSAEGRSPDGAVTDAEGNLWIAEWGSARVACYSPEGGFLRAVEVEAAQSSCPAFGGEDLTTLYCTSAAVGLSAEEKTTHPGTGTTFAIEGVAQGRAEPRVLL